MVASALREKATLERDYDSVRREARSELRRLAERITAGDDSQLIHWVVEGAIAGAHRPLRYNPDAAIGGRVPRIPRSARPLIEAWVEQIIGAGVRSVICLATSEELRRYDDLDFGPDGLLGFLSASGLDVRHLPLADPLHLPNASVTSWKLELQRVQDAACRALPGLAKPVLVFCSGGQDRTPPVTAYLASHLES